MKPFLNCCFLSVLCGCATLPPPVPLPKPPADKAELYVYFGTSESCSGHSVEVLTDGVATAQLKRNEYFSIQLPLGKHTLTSFDSAEKNGDISFDIDAQGGQLYFQGIQEWGINCAPPEKFEIREEDFKLDSRLIKVNARQPLQNLAEPEFQTALAYYSAASPKPVIPEEVR